MTDLPPAALVGQPPFPQAQVHGPPGVVYVAAVLTWVAAGTTAAFTLLLTVGVLWLGAPFFDAFEPGLDNPRTYVVGAAALVVALSAAACVLSVFVLRSSRSAHWLLIGLSAVTALAGLMLASLVGTLVLTAVAIAVIVLLLQPDARAWFREPPAH